ncbi:MAG: hypothetical protein M4579_005874 [Chaenotheca gracillima]|nr:MAG: hypothetical protein M4579_005874 [Chaenotheca gracillima]
MELPSSVRWRRSLLPVASSLSSSWTKPKLPSLASPSSPPAPSHQIRPPPGRRRLRVSGPGSHNNCSVFPSILCILVLFIICRCAGAEDIPPSTFAFENEDSLLRSTLERLDRSGYLLHDLEPLEEAPPTQKVPFEDIDTRFPYLQRREGERPHPKEDESSKTPHPRSVEPSSTATATADSSKASSTKLMTASDMPSASPLPRPFDTSLGSNFTSSSCPNFFSSFLSNSTFKACLPFSLLLQNSNSFFQAERSLVRISQTLDATCNVDVNKCSSLMSGIAQRLISNDNCGLDYQQQNPLVTQAYSGLISYEPLYQAGCLRSSSGSYCFADAITNSSSPSDSYIYYVALGLGLPGGSSPTCNKCLQDTMSILATAASNSTLPVSKTYVGTAQQIDLNCGPTFVNATVPIARGSAAAFTRPSTTTTFGAWALALIIFAWFT